MDHLDLVKLRPLMDLTSGNPNINIGLIDGPVETSHSDISSEKIREIPWKKSGSCSQKASAACQHGTYVAGILSAKRTSSAPAICPGCTLLIRPIFLENISSDSKMPSASPAELAAAITDCIAEGANVINLSVALLEHSPKELHELEQALDHALRCKVIVIAAAGNQGTIGSTPLTRHKWVIPVVACNRWGHPINYSNLGNSIGRFGLRAPGEGISSLGSDGRTLTLDGTSAATPFVTGTVALLWSQVPQASAAAIKLALTRMNGSHRKSILPDLLDAWISYQNLKIIMER